MLLLGFSNPALPKLGFCKNRPTTTSERKRESKRDSSDSFSFVDDNGDVGPTTGLVLSFQRQHHKKGCGVRRAGAGNESCCLSTHMHMIEM